MKKLNALLCFCLLTFVSSQAAIIEVAPADARMTTMIVGGQTVDGDSALYTAATVIFDFEQSAVATKGGHTLTPAVNAPTYSNASAHAGTQYGSYYAVFDDADDEHFTLADHANFDFDDTDYAIAFWYYPEATYATHITSKYDGSNGWRLQSNYSDTNKLVMLHTSEYCYSGFTPDINTWYHVVLSYDQSDNEITWWITKAGEAHGSEVDNQAVAQTTTPTSNSTTLYVGSYSTTATLNGNLDELVFFKGREVNDAEAQSIYIGAGSGGWRE